MRILAWIRANPVISSILVLAFMLRIAGITYGFPLTLVDDEPPFTFAALKMMEMKTLLPILHPAEFSPILYYPPYLSYLYLVPFTLIAGFSYLAWDGPASLFSSHLLTDLSAFFMAARFLNITLGTAAVFLIYKVGEALFTSRRAGLAAAFLLATSVLHIALSMVARHWLPASFIFVLILYILTRPVSGRATNGAHVSLTEEQRYFFALVAAGFGMGISMIMPLYLVFIGLWYFTTGAIPLHSLLRSRLLWLGGFLYIGLSLLPFLLHAKSAGITPDMTYEAQKSLIDFLLIPITTLSYTIYSEPVLTIIAIIGMIFAVRAHRSFTLSSLGFFLAYTAALFFVFRFESRFMLPLVVLYSLFGGYAIARAWKYRVLKYGAMLALCIPFFAAVQLSTLAMMNDTRALAREWALQNLPAGARVIVAARLTRLPATEEAVQELHDIDPAYVRRVDAADASLDAAAAFHALNLFTVEEDDFYATLPAYAKERGYEYLIYSPTFLDARRSATSAFASLIAGRAPIASWQGQGDEYSISFSAFRSWSNALIERRFLGPDIAIYRLDGAR